MTEPEKQEFEGLPNIDDYFEKKCHNCPVYVSELDYIVEAISANTIFTKEQSKRILTLFFQEIRNSLISGTNVTLSNFGFFKIKCVNNLKRIYIKFCISKKLLKQINE